MDTEIHILLAENHRMGEGYAEIDMDCRRGWSGWIMPDGAPLRIIAGENNLDSLRGLNNIVIHYGPGDIPRRALDFVAHLETRGRARRADSN